MSRIRSESGPTVERRLQKSLDLANETTCAVVCCNIPPPTFRLKAVPKSGASCISSSSEPNSPSSENEQSAGHGVASQLATVSLCSVASQCCVGVEEHKR